MTKPLEGEILIYWPFHPLQNKHLQEHQEGTFLGTLFVIEERAKIHCH
ncbi:MAG: hypothetical protein QNL79_09535 [Bacteroidia bacterium]